MRICYLELSASSRENVLFGFNSPAFITGPMDSQNSPQRARTVTITQAGTHITGLAQSKSRISIVTTRAAGNLTTTPPAVMTSESVPTLPPSASIQAGSQSGNSSSGTGSPSMMNGSRRKKPCLSARERNVRRIESNERERLRMHGLNEAFQVNCFLPI